MGAKTGIQWTDATWSPVTGCSKVGAGCKNCYAERFANRTFGHLYGDRGFTDVRCHPERLYQPLRWKKPRRIFVNSMSDLFHENVPFTFITAVFAAMAMSQHHTYQVLTKRPARMFDWIMQVRRECVIGEALETEWLAQHSEEDRKHERERWLGSTELKCDWPLPNVHLGVSVEDQATADERIPILLQTPAAVRFVSVEPLLEAIDLRLPPRAATFRCSYDGSFTTAHPGSMAAHPWKFPCPKCGKHEGWCGSFAKLDWVIVGGESGPNARPCSVDWIRAIVRQCKAAGVRCFVKQVGSRVLCAPEHWIPGWEYWRQEDHGEAWGGGPILRDRKGGDPSEWPEDLRVREYPR